MANRILMLRGMQLAFWIALTFTFVNALLPAEPAVELADCGRVEHFMAFYVLALLGAAAYPRVQLIWVAIALSAFGAAIEVVQGLPIVSRDPDFWGWVTDTVAIFAALSPMILVPWRNHWSKLQRSPTR